MTIHMKNDSGFTIIELLTVVTIIGILAAIAFIGYGQFVERARVVSAMNEVINITKDIRIYMIDQILPIGAGPVGNFFPQYSDRDPWGNFYQYQHGVPGAARLKSDGITPLNSEFDVYSLGRDGLTNPNIAHPDSLDDIIRADDDQFVGKAATYPY